MNTDKSQKIMIALIEDNRFIRSGIEFILSKEPDFKLAGSYQSCEEAFYYDDIGYADIVLMDIKLPGISGIEGVRYLKKHFPEMVIIICTAYEDDENVFNAIAAGAVGFVAKKASPAVLLKTLRNVARGGSPMTPNVARNIISSFEEQTSKQIKNRSELTEKEIKVLEKISVGKSYTTVARELSATEEDVLFQIRIIYGKLQRCLVQLTN